MKKFKIEKLRTERLLKNCREMVDDYYFKHEDEAENKLIKKYEWQKRIGFPIKKETHEYCLNYLKQIQGTL